MILVILAALSVTFLNVALSTAISRNSTLTAMEQALVETTDLAALAAQNMISRQSQVILHKIGNKRKVFWQYAIFNKPAD